MGGLNVSDQAAVQEIVKSKDFDLQMGQTIKVRY